MATISVGGKGGGKQPEAKSFLCCGFWRPWEIEPISIKYMGCSKLSSPWEKHGGWIWFLCTS